MPARDPFEALGDPNRRAIVELLGSGGRSVGEVADALPISRPAVSRHLRLLKEAGLVVEEPQGTRRIYRLHDQGVEAVEQLPDPGVGRRRHPLPADGREHRATAHAGGGRFVSTDPLRLSFDIGCPTDHAFDVWTTRLSSWWPKGHSASGDPDTVVTLEPRLGGRIFERTPDGTEIDWGGITAWNPPHRLGYLWHIGRDRERRHRRRADLRRPGRRHHPPRHRALAAGSGWAPAGHAVPGGQHRRLARLVPNFVAAAEAP